VNRLAKIAVCAAVVLSAGACKRAMPSKGAPETGVARAPVVIRFQPPPDGLLTDAQIDRYVRVRRAARGRSDEEAARAVGVDPEELGWVRARIVEALVALDTAQLRSSAEATYARTIASLRESARSVKDRETLRRMEEQVAGLERERGSLKAGDKPPAAVAANARRVASRRAEIEAMRP
jgi:hypothetical protein